MARPQKYIVTLTDAERKSLCGIIKNHRYSQRERNRAQILLFAEQSNTDSYIAEQVGCHAMTARNVRLRFCQQNQREDQAKDQAAEPFEPLTAKHRVKRAEQIHRAKRVFDGEKEAHLVALACSTPPGGAKRWTLQLLHDRLIQMQVVESIGKETIRRTLKKTSLNRG
jgi:predicted Fe-Mo cluster-binding NifX family protein